MGFLLCLVNDRFFFFLFVMVNVIYMVGYQRFS